MAGENEAYGSVFKGQEGTGDAFLVQGADEPIKAYDELRKEDALRQKKLQENVSKLDQYVVHGYDKHVPMFIQEQKDLTKEAAGLYNKYNGHIPAVEDYELKRKQNELKANMLVSDKIGSHIKDQLSRYVQLKGEEGSQGYDELKNFLDKSPEEQMHIANAGQLPQILPKEEVVDWRKNAADSVNRPMIKAGTTTVDANGNTITNESDVLNIPSVEKSALSIATGGAEGRGKDGIALIADAKKQLSTDAVYQSLPPEEQKAQLIKTAAKNYADYQRNHASASTGFKNIPKDDKEDKDAWKTGNGYATRGNFIVRKQNRPSIYKGSMAPDQQDPNSVEYSVGQKNGGNNPPLTFQDVNGSDLISFTTKKPVKVDTGVNNPTQLEDAIKTHDFVFKDYVEDNGKVYAKVVSKQGIGYTAGSNATPFEIPAGTYLIPIDKARGALVGYPTFEEVKDKLSESDVYKPSEVTGKSSRASGSGTPPIKNKKELADKFGAI